MTRKNAKELLSFIKAYAEGKQIQFFNGDKWIDLEFPNFNEESCLYRIKSEPKYRPFKSVEECWKEMKNHYPFGWLKSKTSLEFNSYEISEFSDWEHRFKNYTFADGIPYGIKEE